MPFVFESRAGCDLTDLAYGLHVHQIWLTAIGRDKPGIVARIARVLLEHGLNIEDSQMRILGGRFAMMLLLRGSASEEALYKDLLATGRELGLDYIYVHPIADADTRTPKPTHMASLYGADRPGQVAAVADRLATLRVNISGLSTRVEGQASVQELELTVPEGVDIRAELTAVAHERGIRLELVEL
jgi:glycine cleavage system transcriptional repressor